MRDTEELRCGALCAVPCLPIELNYPFVMQKQLFGAVYCYVLYGLRSVGLFFPLLLPQADNFKTTNLLLMTRNNRLQPRRNSGVVVAAAKV